MSERVCVWGVEHLGGKARKGRNPITVSKYPRHQVKGGVHTRVQNQRNSKIK